MMICRQLEGTNILEECMVPATWHHPPEVTLKFTVIIIIIIIISNLIKTVHSGKNIFLMFPSQNKN